MDRCGIADNFFRRVALRYVKCAARIVRSFIRSFEQYVQRRNASPNRPPVFIIGPARSGTTVVYQAISAGLNVGFISNNELEFPNFPILAAWISKRLGLRRVPQLFVSEYGRVDGRWAPAQGWELWSRWFPRVGDKTAEFEVTEDWLRGVRAFVGGFEWACANTFVNKWNGHSVHLALLDAAFPNALFVRTKRDLIDNAVSVYKGRIDLCGKPTQSMTRVSRSYERIALSDPVEQACAYVMAIEYDLECDIDTLGRERFFTVDYAEFCGNPRATIAEISAWYTDRCGFVLNPRHPLPAKFPISTGKGGVLRSQMEATAKRIMSLIREPESVVSHSRIGGGAQNE